MQASEALDSASEVLIFSPVDVDMMFLVSQCFSAIPCVWFQSNKVMNQRAHCKHGTGRRAIRKGRAKARLSSRRRWMSPLVPLQRAIKNS